MHRYSRREASKTKIAHGESRPPVVHLTAKEHQVSRASILSVSQALLVHFPCVALPTLVG